MKWLRRFRAFRSVSQPKLAHLSRVIALQRVPRGHVVCREGEPGLVFYVILSGEVEVEVAAAGSVGLMGTGSAFGEQALLDNSRRTATVTAVTECELLRLEKRDVRGAAGAAAKRGRGADLSSARSLMS